MKIKNDLRPILRFLRDKYAERSEGSRQLEEIEKYVQQLIREADIVREQKEQNVPDDEIWIDRTIAMLMAKWKIKWNKLTEVQQRSFKGADAVGIEKGAAAEKEDEGKTEKVTFWNDVSEKVQMNCRFWMDDMV